MRRLGGIPRYAIICMVGQEREGATMAGTVTAEQLVSLAPIYQAMAKHIVDFPFSVSTGKLPISVLGSS